MLERGGQASDCLVVQDRYRLALLGSFSLSFGGQCIAGLSRKSRGLIAYLALTGGVAARDRIAELLWDGRGFEQARASLRQACYELRHALLADVPLLSFERDEIGLVRANLGIDVDELGGGRDRLLSALEPSRGELLRDLNGLSPAFDDWLRMERARVHGERRALALGCARAALAAKRPADAKDVACALLRLDSADEEAVGIALAAMRDVGDVEGARALYARHAKALRTELDVGPAPANAAIAEALARAPDSRNGGSRAAGWATIGAWQMAEDSGPSATGQRPASRRRQMRFAAVALVLAGSAAALIVGAEHFRPPPAQLQATLVKVEPLAAEAGDTNAQAVSASLRPALVRELAGSETPVEIVDAGTASRPVGLTVRGTSLSDHGKVRANVELVYGASGQVIWASTLDRPVAEIDQFQQQLSLQVARELHCAYADGRAPYFNRDVEFARLTLSHCDTIGRDDDDSVRFDDQITRLAPGFARGWAEYAMDTVASASGLTPALRAATDRRADSYARRALALDPHQGLAYAALSTSHDGSPWSERVRITRAGLAADPTSPELHFRIADDFASIGRLDDALRESKLTFQYDHLLPGKVFLLGETEALVGDFDDAADALARGHVYWPDQSWFNDLALDLGVAGHDPREALRLVVSHQVRLDPVRARVLQAFLEWRVAPSPASATAAVRTIQDAAEHGPVTGEEVRLLAASGQIDAAYALARKLPAEAFGEPAWFGPDLAGFRSDPRFFGLAARLGFARVWWQTGLWPDFCSGRMSACRATVAAALAQQRAPVR